MTLRFGNSLKMQEIRPITQWRKLNVNNFLKTFMQTKVILVKPGDQLMNSNLGKVNQAVSHVNRGNKVYHLTYWYCWSI